MFLCSDDHIKQNIKDAIIKCYILNNNEKKRVNVNIIFFKKEYFAGVRSIISGVRSIIKRVFYSETHSIIFSNI